MKIYQETKFGYNIYDLVIKDQDKLYAYRKNEMANIAEANQVITFKSNDLINYFLRIDDTVPNNKVIPYNVLYVQPHFFVNNKQGILEQFYQNQFNECKLIKTRKTNHEGNWQYHYFICCDPLAYCNDRVTLIEIPESLYILQAIIQKKFQLLNLFFIDEQLDLFDLNYLGTVTDEELTKFEQLEIAKDCKSSIKNKACNDKILMEKLINKITFNYNQALSLSLKKTNQKNL